MTLGQALNLGKYAVIIGLVGTLWYKIEKMGRVGAENRALKTEILEAQLANDGLQSAIQKAQEAQDAKQRESDEYRRQASEAKKTLKRLRDSADDSDCLNSPIPADVVRLLQETSNSQ